MEFLSTDANLSALHAMLNEPQYARGAKSSEAPLYIKDIKMRVLMLAKSFAEYLEANQNEIAAIKDTYKNPGIENLLLPVIFATAISIEDDEAPNVAEIVCFLSKDIQYQKDTRQEHEKEQFLTDVNNLKLRNPDYKPDPRDPRVALFIDLALQLHKDLLIIYFATIAPFSEPPLPAVVKEQFKKEMDEQNQKNMAALFAAKEAFAKSGKDLFIALTAKNKHLSPQIKPFKPIIDILKKIEGSWKDYFGDDKIDSLCGKLQDLQENVIKSRTEILFASNAAVKDFSDFSKKITKIAAQKNREDFPLLQTALKSAIYMAGMIAAKNTDPVDENAFKEQYEKLKTLTAEPVPITSTQSTVNTTSTIGLGKKT